MEFDDGAYGGFAVCCSGAGWLAGPGWRASGAEAHAGWSEYSYADDGFALTAPVQPEIEKKQQATAAGNRIPGGKRFLPALGTLLLEGQSAVCAYVGLALERARASRRVTGDGFAEVCREVAWHRAAGLRFSAREIPRPAGESAGLRDDASLTLPTESPPGLRQQLSRVGSYNLFFGLFCRNPF